MNPQNNLRFIAMPHVLSIEKGRIDVQRPAGGSVNDLMRSIGWTPDSLSARVFIDGEYVKDAAWEYTVPRAGQSVIVRAIPMGGGGGQGKDTMQMVAMVGIMVLAIGVSAGWAAPLAGTLFGAGGWAAMVGGSTAALLAGGAISIIGTLGIAGRIPQALPRLCDQREVCHG